MVNITFIDFATAAAEKHAETKGGLPQLDFSTYTAQIFWLAVFFIFLYIFFSKKTIPEISSTIEGRREKIEDDLDNAGSLKEEAETVQTTYEESLTAAREKSNDTFKKTEENIKTFRDNKLKEFKKRTEKLNAETEAKVEKEKTAAMQEANDVAAEIAQLAAEKIIGVSTDLKKAKALIKDLNKKAA